MDKAIDSPKIFISHAMGEDSNLAHRLADDLRQQGYEIWIAPNSILPDEEWVPAINRGLECSRIFVIILSRKALESKWVRLEMNTAIDLERSGHIDIIPLQREVCEIPSLWRAYQAIPFQIYGAGLPLLFEALQSPSSYTAYTSSPFSVELSLITKLYVQGGVSSLTYSPEGDLLIGGRNGEVSLWTMPEGNEHTKFTAHGKTLTEIAISPLNNVLATASEDNTIRLWSLPDVDLIYTLTGHDGTVTSLDFSPNGELLVSGSRDGTARVWSAPNGDSINVLDQHTKSIYGVAFSPDGKLIATASSDYCVYLWTVDDDYKPSELGRSTYTTLLRAVFSPDGKALAVGTWSGVIRLWDVVERKSVGILEGHRDRVYGLNFAPDGKLLASGSKDGYLRLWNMPEGNLAYPPIEAHGGWIRSLAFSPDGEMVVSGDSDGVVTIWGLKVAH